MGAGMAYFRFRRSTEVKVIFTEEKSRSTEVKRRFTEVERRSTEVKRRSTEGLGAHGLRVGLVTL